MRIAVFHDDCGDPGGANSYRLRLSSLLKEREHEIFLFTYRGAEEETDDPNTTIFVPGGSRAVGGLIPQHLLPNLSVYKAVQKWLTEINPDILHIHTNYSFISSVLLGCRGIVPAVQTVHDFRMVCPTERGVTPSGRLCGGGISWECVSERCVSRKRYALEVFNRKTRYPLIRRTIYRLIAPSMALCSALEREGLPAVHIPHYSDIDGLRYQPADRENHLVLFVGYLHFSKGVGLLLLAFRDVLEAVPEARLAIAGDGPMMEELREYHKTLGLGNAVNFLGVVPEKDVKQWYQKSSFVVLPSIIYENSPLIIYEAMASGRAVVGTRIGGIPELVKDGTNGLLFERNNPSDLAEKIIKLLKDKDLSEKMGKAGRERAENEYTTEKHLNAIIDIYENAIRGQP